MVDYKAKASFMALMAASLALAGCSKPAVEATSEPAAQESTAPAAQAPTAPAGPEPVTETAVPATRAASIAVFIDERPECAEYREQLDAAGTTATSAELVAVLEKAHKAGCSKKQ